MDFPKQISKRTQTGLWVLIVLIFVVVGAMHLYDWIQNKLPIDVDMEVVEIKVQEIENIQRTEFHNKHNKKEYSKFRVPLKKFNPNEYTIQDWIKLGLSDKQAQVIIRFKQKRQIKNNDNLRQIFVINEELYELIKDSTFYESKNKK